MTASGDSQEPDLDVRVLEQVELLARRMREAGTVAALTGAGISTGSGLPDYRGDQGLWRNRRFEELASIEMFSREPVEFWEFYRMRLAGLRHARPNAGHDALAALEQAGVIERVITQNVDGLHEVAGSRPLEVHGSLRHAECLRCGDRIDIDETERRADAAHDGVPRCEPCGDPLKPCVVLFGEMLPPAIDEAWRLAERCDLLLVCGSSLAVQPVGALPYVTSAHGGAVAVVNIGETAADGFADIRIDAELSPVLSELAARVL